MNIRKLTANEIECRVATVKDKGISLLLYKTARVDRAILDEYYGDLWQNDFKLIDGKMYGGIGIYNKDLNQWLWRWDCGTESNTEAEKGQASDCFKRAGFKWGIGIELYSAPFIWVSGNGNELKYEKYAVTDIGYSSSGDINKLKIINSKTKQVVFETGKFTSTKPTPIDDSDLDIFEGLKTMDTSDNAQDYYQKFKNSVRDIEKFKKEYGKIWKALRRKEKVNAT